MPAPFHAFGTSHLIVLALCGTLLCLMALAARWAPALSRVLEKTLAILLLTSWPLSVLAHWQLGELHPGNSLPLHLCDVAAIAGGLALLTRHQLAAEILYFFGMAGTLQGLITPNLNVDFPEMRFFSFFILHGGVVIAALHVVTAMKCPPRPGSVPRMVGLTLAYAAAVGMANAALGTNYAFLCHKPQQASLMDALGSWPWYIGSLVLLCGLFYTLLYAPFFIRHQLRRLPAPAGE
jgi:hypothetical integral membrane protein (TIGR02206 family)